MKSIISVTFFNFPFVVGIASCDKSLEQVRVPRKRGENVCVFHFPLAWWVGGDQFGKMEPPSSVAGKTIIEMENQTTMAAELRECWQTFPGMVRGFQLQDSVAVVCAVGSHQTKVGKWAEDDGRKRAEVETVIS